MFEIIMFIIWMFGASIQVGLAFVKFFAYIPIPPSPYMEDSNLIFVSIYSLFEQIVYENPQYNEQEVSKLITELEYKYCGKTYFTEWEKMRDIEKANILNTLKRESLQNRP